MTRTAWGAGLTTIAADGSTLDAWFRWLGWGEFGDDAMVAAYPELDTQLGLRDQHDAVRNVTVRPIRLTIDVDAAPDVGGRRLPPAAPALAPAGRAALDQPRRHLRRCSPTWCGRTSARSPSPRSTTCGSG